MPEPQPSDVVTIEREGPVGLVAINNPPVNAASHAVRLGLIAALDALEADDGVAVIALYGAGRTFVAGADIREFGKPPVAPVLPQVCERLEASPKPVVAVLHASALGGGLEIALACHARVAIEGLMVGFPEVTLGILPGAGGTQRAPRLAGIAAALDLITTGKRIDAAQAAALGLVDRIVAGDPRAVALASAREILDGTLATRRTGALAAAPDPDAIEAARGRVAAKQPGLVAPQRCIDAVAASTQPLAEGIAEERRLYLELLAGAERAALVHAFFAERTVSKIPEAKATARPIASVGVVGGGLMGSGIATAALTAGLPVRLAERDEASLARGRAAIEKNLEGAVKRGKMRAEERERILAEQLSGTTDLAAMTDVDLIVEAVFEDIAVKQEIFRALDAAARPGAILATNTSYLDVNAIAAVTDRPADVIGLHFFSPANVMRLLEVVVADETAPEVVATGFALARRLGKIAVRAGVCDGFIGNRILAHYRKSAEAMMMDGASPQEIDEALERFGFAMGPFRVMDLAGLDIAWAQRKRLASTRPPEERYVPIADRICEAGWFGRKSGRGYYVYENGKATANLDVLAIIDEERRAAGITPRAFSADEIVERYMTAMIAEGTRVLEEGIALRPIDIDAVYLFGYGFPRHRGGPMFYADTVGAPELVRRIEAYSAHDPHYWRVPALLAAMARDGTSFADRNDA